MKRLSEDGCPVIRVLCPGQMVASRQAAPDPGLGNDDNANVWGCPSSLVTETPDDRGTSPLFQPCWPQSHTFDAVYQECLCGRTTRPFSEASIPTSFLSEVALAISEVIASASARSVLAPTNLPLHPPQRLFLVITV